MYYVKTILSTLLLILVITIVVACTLDLMKLAKFFGIFLQPWK